MEQTALNRAMQEVLEAHLPAQTTGEIGRYLSDLRGKASRVEELEKESLELKKSLASYRQKEMDMEQKERRLVELTSEVSKRETEVKKREIDADIVTLKIANAEAKAALVMECFKIPFANRQFRESVNGFAAVGVPSGGFASSGSQSSTRTVDES